jgi:diphthine-ammonia ligase
MRVAVLYSGGKDSTFCTHVALRMGWQVECLVTLVPEREDSWMFHHPCIELTKLQAESMGLRHVMHKTSGVKELELQDLTAALRQLQGKVDGIVSGAIASRYQKDRIEAICKELDFRSITPLWGKDQVKLLHEEVDAGFDIIFTGVATEGLTKDWIGRMLDSSTIAKLGELKEKYGINPAGEGGEYESLVIDGPIFKKRLVFDGVERCWDDATSSGHLLVKGAKLESKQKK